jgi:hypothetical protein
MLAVAALGQAWEAFFAEFVYSTYVWRPFFMSSSISIHRMQRLSERVAKGLRKLSFAKLRSLVANTIIQQIEPMDLTSAEAEVAKLDTAAIKNMPSQATIDAVADPSARELLSRLVALEVLELRNRVVHHDAYRPTRAEVSRCIDDEIRFLYRLKRYFAIGTPLEHQTGQTRRRYQQAG